MSVKYAIAIGGSGARCVEALIHLCAAGLGPDNLKIFFIDPDKDNGNLSRTRRLITSYMNCKRTLQEAKPDWLFRTDISIADPDTWTIFQKDNQTLKEYTDFSIMSPELRHFANVLFSERELDTSLGQGFRGHPNIGAVAMADPDFNRNPWQALRNDLTNGAHRGDTQIFIFGSIFGGTGAAGFATISYQIKNLPENKIDEHTSKAHLGGGLLLPYFAVPAPPPGMQEMFVQSADFHLAAKAALKYYYAKDIGCDDLYLIGDDNNRELGKFSTGTATQENAPHYIELIAALAATDFYDNPPREDIVPDPHWYLAGRKKGSPVSWQNVPVARSPELARVKSPHINKRLATFFTYAYAFVHEALPRVKEPHTKNQTEWYINNFRSGWRRPGVPDCDFKNHNETLNAHELFYGKALTWASQVSLDPLTDLFDTYALLNAPGQDERAVGKLLQIENAGGDAFYNLIDAANRSDIPVEKRDIGRLSTLFYKASEQFCAANYHFT